MKLTKRQRQVLVVMADETNDDDLVEDGTRAYIGDDRTSVALILSLLRLMLIAEEEDTFNGDKSFHRYYITEQGRRALADPSYDVAELIKRIS